MWAMNWWRKMYLNNQVLHQEKADMLVDIGFKYQTVDEMNDKKFMENYKEAKLFYDEYGHFPTHTESKRISLWAKCWWVRTYLKNQELYQEKADMLIAIGFEYKGKKQ